MRRVMGGESGLLAPHRVGRNQEKTHEATIVTDKVNAMRGNRHEPDRFTLEEVAAYVFVAVEHANSEIIVTTPPVQPIASRRRSRSGRGCIGACQRPSRPEGAGMGLRHDHGSNYMSGDFQDEIKCLGIEASPSFVREPEGNGVAERFIRTLKENLLWVRTFKTTRNCAPSSSHSPGATMKLGSPRGMDKTPARVRRGANHATKS